MAENETPATQSLRDRILAAQDLDSAIVEVPQWGVKVKIEGMSGRERARMLKTAMDRDTGDIDYEVLYPMLIVATVYDPETGEKVFTEDDLDALNGKSGAALEFVGQKAAELSGMTEAAVNSLGEGSSPVTRDSTGSDALPST